ncbi:hypothetical protein [Mycetohabitans sp. B6]
MNRVRGLGADVPLATLFVAPTFILAFTCCQHHRVAHLRMRH